MLGVGNLSYLISSHYKTSLEHLQNYLNAAPRLVGHALADPAALAPQ